MLEIAGRVVHVTIGATDGSVHRGRRTISRAGARGVAVTHTHAIVCELHAGPAVLDALDTEVEVGAGVRGTHGVVGVGALVITAGTMCSQALTVRYHVHIVVTVILLHLTVVGVQYTVTATHWLDLLGTHLGAPA